MTDRIVLRGLTFYGHHGVADAEQAVGGRYAVDLALVRDLAAAGSSDQLTDTTNYAAVARAVVALGTGQRFRLLEALAAAIAAAVLEDFAVEVVTVAVTKLQPPLAEMTSGTATVEITRRRPVAPGAPQQEG
jgi:dihydroneopterin aldolase